MRIRLSLTLDIHKDRNVDDEPDRETSADALVERAEPHRERPGIGFYSMPEDAT